MKEKEGCEGRSACEVLGKCKLLIADYFLQYATR